MPFRTIASDLGHVRRVARESGLPGLANLFRSRESPVTVQFIKYGLCGVGAVIVHHIVLLILLNSAFPISSELDDAIREKHVLYANLLSWPFGNLFAYLANSRWVFQQGRHSGWVEFALFSAISLFSFLIGLLGGPLLISEGLPVAFAQIGLIVTSTVVNFLCRKFLVFLS